MSDQRVCEDPEVKSQWVRGLDVFLIGPLMVAGGVALHKRGQKGWGWLLGMFGVTTVLYNGRNFLIVRERQQRRLAQDT